MRPHRAPAIALVCLLHTTYAAPPSPVACDTAAGYGAAIATAAVTSLSFSGNYTPGDVGIMRFTRGGAFDNNPSSLYGIYDFTALDLPVFFLGPSDALLWVGCTPPPLKYFSARSYLFSRPGGGGDVAATLFASLGDSNNIFTMNTTRNNGSSCNSTAAIITTADVQTGEDVTRALIGAGFPPNAVNLDIVPAPLVSLCRNLTCDLFNFLMRVALFEDADAGAAYVNATWPVYNILATPARQAAVQPYGIPALRPRSSVDEEAWLEASLDALNTAATSFWTSQGHASVMNVQRGLPVNTTGYACIADGSDCAGDNRDAAYVAAGTAITLPDDNSLILVCGVDHAALSGCTYSNVDVNDDVTGTGVDGVDNSHFVGSAAVYGDFNNTALMYAFLFARNCSLLPSPQAAFCVDITFTQVPATHMMTLAERAYLQLSSRTGPNATLLTMPWVTTLQRQ